MCSQNNSQLDTSGQVYGASCIHIHIVYIALYTSQEANANQTGWAEYVHAFLISFSCSLGVMSVQTSTTRNQKALIDIQQNR